MPMKEEYQIKLKDTINDSEETSSVSLISYEIENAKDHGLTNDKIKEQVKVLSDGGNFPHNLEYVDSYSDPLSGMTSSQSRQLKNKTLKGVFIYEEKNKVIC